MSDDDEPPTEPSAALTGGMIGAPGAAGAAGAPTEPDAPTEPLEAVRADAAAEPKAPGEPAPSGARSAFGSLKYKRVAAVVIGIGLLWLGVWTYSSGSSSATGTSGTVATVAPPTTKAGGGHGGKKHKDKGAPASTLAPPANLARTPQAFSSALFGDWMNGDQTDALRVADAKAVKQLFRRHVRTRDHWVAQGCAPAGSGTNCTWSAGTRQLVMQVQNPTATVVPRVIAVTIQR